MLVELDHPEDEGIRREQNWTVQAAFEEDFRVLFVGGAIHRTYMIALTSWLKGTGTFGTGFVVELCLGMLGKGGLFLTYCVA